MPVVDGVKATAKDTYSHSLRLSIGFRYSYRERVTDIVSTGAVRCYRILGTLTAGGSAFPTLFEITSESVSRSFMSCTTADKSSMSDQQRDLFDVQPPQWELDDQGEVRLATVVFATAPHGEFDYLIPDELVDAIQIGCRVKVPLGKSNRKIVGYCVRIHLRKASPRSYKAVVSVIDAVPLISDAILELTRWMAEYYVCHHGTILETVVPASVRGGAGTRSQILIHVPTNVAARLTQLKLSKKQAEVLKYLAASPVPMTPSDLAVQIGCTTAPITALRKKGLVHEQRRRVYTKDFDESPAERTQPHKLNQDQAQCLDAIVKQLHSAEHATFLLHGITGSGKTEVYIQAIEEVIRFGRQAIVLVPEISLTPQTRRRFRSRLDNVAVLHSNLSAAERHWQWQRIARGEVQVVVGARSAIFAPTPNLGLIVLDEEHEPSFKQDTNPRYHARTVALRRAQKESIPLVLGSATPALESWHCARTNEYKLLRMPRRAMDRPLPHVTVVDMRDEKYTSTSRGSLSRRLRQAMTEEMAAGGQVILLLNRRGFSTFIQCPACGEAVKCPNCEIALTHHRDIEKAVCHYCDYRVTTPNRCPDCRFGGIRFGGLGTQRLEAEIRASFPQARCLRMDSDTMRKPGSHEEALGQFRRGDVDILLGTQMIAKGLDFPNVTLVGVVNADTALHLPDFRAGERTFQLVTQVAGRTGRGERGGHVLVQTFSPDNAAIEAASRHAYASFADHELPLRREFRYPPYSSVVRYVFRGENLEYVSSKAMSFANVIRERTREFIPLPRILGPAPAPIEKLRGKYRFHLLIQTERYADLCSILHQMQTSERSNSDVEWIVDVDPISML